jgi:Flp pilus assembly protein CpaB
MKTRSRLRNLALPLGLAALAAILVGIYIASYRNSVDHGAGLVKVLVAARDIPGGTDGSSVAAGGYLSTQTIPRRAVVPGSITSASALTSLVSTNPIYKGEQITLRQFSPITQGGVFAKFSGTQRAIAIGGDPFQLLAGTLENGDHVDVVSTTMYHVGGMARSTTRVILRNLLVLKAPDASKSSALAGATPTVSATVVMTDDQAQTMGWAMKNTRWFFALRPTNHPSNSGSAPVTLFSFLTRGVSASLAPRIIAGTAPYSGAFAVGVDDGK